MFHPQSALPAAVVLAWSLAAPTPAAAAEALLIGSEAWRSAGDVELVLSQGDLVWTVGGDEVRAFDAQGRAVHRFEACPGEGGLTPFGTAILSPDGQHMALSCQDLRLVRLPEGRELWRSRDLRTVSSQAFHPDGTELVVVAERSLAGGQVQAWTTRRLQTSSGRTLAEHVGEWVHVQAVEANARGVAYIGASMDQAHLLGLDRQLREVWRAPRGRDRHVVNRLPGLLCISGLANLACLDVLTGAEVDRFVPPLHESGEWRYQLSPGRVRTVGDVLWIDWSEGVHRWRPGEEAALLAHQPPGREWCTHGDGALTAAGGPRLVHLEASGAWTDPDSEWSAPYALALSHGGTHLALVDDHGRLYAGAVSGGGLSRVDGRWDWDLLVLSPDGQTLLAEERGSSRPLLVDLGTGERRPLTLDGNVLDYASGLFRPDGALLVTAAQLHGDGAHLGTVDLSTGALSPSAPLRSAYDLHWLHPDGQQVLASWNDSAWLLDLATGERGERHRHDSFTGSTLIAGVLAGPVEHEEGHSVGDGPVLEASLWLGPPGAPYLASSFMTEELQLRHPRTHAVIHRVREPHTRVRAFSADGRVVAVAREDGRIRVVRLAAP